MSGRKGVGCAVLLLLMFLCGVLGLIVWGAALALDGEGSAASAESGWATPVEPTATLFPTTVPRATFVPSPSAGPTLPPLNPAAPLPTPLQSVIPYRAVVQILALRRIHGDLVPIWSGSGTIVDPRGLILTNAHVALPQRGERVDALEVLLTESEDHPPVPKYFATVVQADRDLDLAVLRVTTDLQGRVVDPSTLNLPYVRLGDANDLHLGDSLAILGYPGIGGNTITLTRGEVSGFTAEKGHGPRAFIKTSATIAGGNSGGMAVNAQGEIVAIPTQLGSGEAEGDVIDCRYIADTNGDGVVDEDDDCVPTGGFINALRPINLAKPLIEDALEGEVAAAPDNPSSAPVAQATPGAIYLADDFSDANSGWAQYSSKHALMDYTANGRYRMAVWEKQWQAWSVYELTVADVVIEVSATKIGGSDDGDFGVICRYQDDGYFYYFGVGADGYYQIIRVGPDGDTFLLGERWPYSEAIYQGDNVTNHLRASCVGDTLRLEVNGHLLAEVHDDTYRQGMIGLSVSTNDEPVIDVYFDDFVARAPSR